MMKRHFYSFGIVIVLGVSCLFLFIFLAHQSDQARADFYHLQNELESYRKSIWHLEKLDPQQLEWQLVKMNTRFLSPDQLGTLIGELTELAKTCNISITSISPSEKVESRSSENKLLSRLSRIPIEMKLRGRYEHIAEFLSRLNSLENGIMEVDRFSLESEKPDDSSLILSLVASVYVKNSAEQKILEEEVAEAPFERLAEKSRFQKIERDPFTKTVIQVKTEIPITLQGILYDSKQPIALVNGEARGVGEIVNDMKIIEINSDNVVLEKDGQKTKLQLRWD